MIYTGGHLVILNMCCVFIVYNQTFLALTVTLPHGCSSCAVFFVFSDARAMLIVFLWV